MSTKTKTSEMYWKDRSEQLLLDVLEDGEKVHRKLKSAYSKAQRDIENDIRLLLFRFQTQTGLDSKAAYELFKGEEFKQWRMDIGEYLAQIEATGDEKLLLELNTLAMRSRINRLEALQGQIKANMAALANEETKRVGEHLAKAYEKTFYQNMYSHYKENTAAFIAAANKSKIRLDVEAIKRLVLENWKGSNYSKRIWKRQYGVAELISDAVARNITRGQSLDNNVKQMMDSIKKTGLDPKLKSDYEFNCKRLIMTETAYMKAKADIDTYKRVGIEEYKFLATLDNKTSDECQAHDNKIYKVEDAEPGINYPPLHPQCRSTTIAVGEYTRKDGTRAARRGDGSVYYVDKNLDYKAWKEKYVDNPEGDNDFSDDEFNRAVGRSVDRMFRFNPPKPLSKLKTKYRKEIMDTIFDAPDEVRRLILANKDNIKFANINSIGGSRHNKDEGLYVNLKADSKNKKGKWATLFHEIGHSIDRIYGYPSASTKLTNALEQDFVILTNSVKMRYNVDTDGAYKIISKYLRENQYENGVHVVSDLLGGLSNNACVGNYLHRTEYWKSGDKLNKELFAHFFSKSVLNDEKGLNLIKLVFPKAFREFGEIIRGL